ncbi:MAG TPA: VanW family protein, partial [Chthonomonadales bacterium]|nr:VanW family protein [Chthonomonadales bacterium]
MKRSNKGLKFLVISTGLLSGLGVAKLTAYTQRPTDTIPDGVHFAGRDWSKKPVASARAELESWAEVQRQEKITLKCTDSRGRERRWQPRRADLGAEVDIDATLETAQAVGRAQTGFERLMNLLKAPEKLEIAPRWTVDTEKIRAYLKKQVAPAVLRPSRDARFCVLKAGFQIVPERSGSALDMQAAIEAVTIGIVNPSPKPVQLPLQVVEPRIKAANLKDIRGEVARYQTYYSERGNRRRNIEVACRHINGTVLLPGDIFSYNRVVGPRNADAGFRKAPVIIRGRLMPDWGGGVCQVSSTLYNAVLLADLKIIRRSHHAFPVRYIPSGRDATVVYDGIDLRFANNTDGPIAIAADGSGGRVLMRIFGKPVPGRKVIIERTHISRWPRGVRRVSDPSLPTGRTIVLDPGHSGHAVKVWRKVFIHGKLVKRELISSDRYSAFPRIIAVGTGPAPT